jgi:phosphonate transport system substrate-binding protein
MNYRYIINIGTIACLLLASYPLLARNHSIKFGSVAMDVPSVMYKRLTPLTKYLSKQLGEPVSLMLSKDMPDAIQNVSQSKVEFAYLTPVAYIRSHAKGKTQLIVKMKTKNKDTFRLMIVVRQNSPIHSVKDILGKSFAFGDEAALLQRAVVVGAGLPLNKLGSYNYLNHYDNIVRAVLLGKYDAGILKDTMAYKWKNKGIRIVYSSPDLPPYNIAASSKVSPAMLAKLKDAFMSLNTNTSEHQAIIKALDKNYDGFATASDADYDVVRRLIKPFRN